MTTGPISAASLSEYVLSSGNTSELQQAAQGLQNSLASGDLNGAQSAFQNLQTVSQNLATASGSSSSQFSTDLQALGTALSSGDLSGAQSAFATVQSDLKGNSSPSLESEANAAAQSQQLVEGLLSTLDSDTGASGTTDMTTSILEGVYGSKALNVVG